MSCSNPSLAVDFGLKENGKRNIKFLPLRYDWSFDRYKERYGDSLLLIPCGKCEGCILARRKMWSLRCFAESMYHRENCFVTLTFDDEHYPSVYNKEPMQKFIKDLRNRGISVRYFGCGEFGSLSGRFHLHLILFGYFPADAKYYSKSNSGFPQYTSDFLTKVWNKGFVVVSQFTPEVAGYVAGYVDKKYKLDDSFILMSKRPGIGERYFYDHYKEFYRTDSLVTNFGSHIASIPKYFDKLAEKIGLDLSDLKDSRLYYMKNGVYSRMRKLGFLNYEDLLKHDEIIFKDKLKHKKRGN